jgi:hypothetical protein
VVLRSFKVFHPFGSRGEHSSQKLRGYRYKITGKIVAPQELIQGLSGTRRAPTDGQPTELDIDKNVLAIELAKAVFWIAQQSRDEASDRSSINEA